MEKQEAKYPKARLLPMVAEVAEGQAEAAACISCTTTNQPLPACSVCQVELVAQGRKEPAVAATMALLVRMEPMAPQSSSNTSKA